MNARFPNTQAIPMKTLLAIAAALLVAVPAFADRAEDAARYTKDLKTSKDAKTKITAIEELGKLAAIRKSYGKEAIPYIMEVCKDKDAKLRAAAAEGLGKAYSGDEDEKVVTLLADLVKEDKVETVKMAAARGLAAMGPRAKAALPTMRQVMQAEPMQSRLRNVLRQTMQQINVR